MPAGFVNPFSVDREVLNALRLIGEHTTPGSLIVRRAMAACVTEQVSPNAARKPRSTTATTTTVTGKPTCWQHRLFGKQLVRCSQINDRMSIDSAAASLVHEDGRPACEIIGMYFSFVNPDATCDDFTRQLIDLYASVNGAQTTGNNAIDEKKKKFEVVHVVLWSNMTDVLDFDESFRAHVADLPWLAVSNRDYERKVNKFGILLRLYMYVLFCVLLFLSLFFQYILYNLNFSSFVCG